MQKLKVMAVSGAFIAASMGVASSTASTTTTTTTAQPTPCPSGMVCIYKGTTNKTPIQRGLYKLGPATVAMTGKHLIVNQLWDKRKVTVHTHRDGTGTTLATITTSQRFKVVDMTRAKSVTVQKACPVKTCFTKVPQ